MATVKIAIAAPTGIFSERKFPIIPTVTMYLAISTISINVFPCFFPSVFMPHFNL